MKRPILIALLAISAMAQKPTATLPTGITGSLGGPYSGTTINTTYSLPVGGTTWNVSTAAQFTTALNNSQPGDVIVLSAGSIYSGNFTLPAKTNPSHKWIYIVTSDYAGLPAPGVRVAPSDASHMPKVQNATGNYVFTLAVGADHWRFVGLEITSPAVSTTELMASGVDIGLTMPDSITIDRCYLHGTNTTDVRRAVDLNASNYAIIDSYIANIHQNGSDSQAVAGWFTPGPIKIVNNYLEAASENSLFGGAGGLTNTWVPSDIEIRGNHYFKPLTWIPTGIVVKNLFELKSARRVLVDSNVFENVWPSGQNGYAFQLTPRPNQSGLVAVVDDVTITNNILKNVSSGFTLLASDNNCVPPSPCTNPGELRRTVIYNNLIELGDTSQQGYGTGAVAGFLLLLGANHSPLMDAVIQHDTILAPPNLTYCNSGEYFDISGTAPFNPPYSRTTNIWILDSVQCRQINGPAGWVGQFSYVLTDYMGDPPPPDTRLWGNLFFKSATDTAYTVPAHNVVSGTAPTFNANYVMTSPDFTGNTTDGLQSGFLGISPAVTLVSIAVTPVSPSIVAGSTLQFTATGTYSDSSTQNLTSTATWASGTPATATIASGGLATAVAAGTTVITATVGSIVSPGDTLTVTGSGPTLTSITISPLNASIVPFATLQYAATCHWSDSTTTDCTGTVAWASSNMFEATINASGLATAGSASGTTIISASYGAVSGSSALSVLKACF